MTTSIPDAPQSTDLPDVRARRGPVFAAVIALVVVGAVGVVALVRSGDKAAAAKQAKAYRSLERCLLGTELAPGETASARFRRIHLTALAVDPLQSKEPIWPRSCATYAHALHEALFDAGRASKDGKDTAYYAEALGKLLQDPQVKDEVQVNIERLWAEASKEKFAVIAVPDVRLPPKAATPLTLDRLKKVPALSTKLLKLDGIKTERNFTGDIHFYVDERAHLSPAQLCTFGTDLICQPIDAKLADRDLILGGTAEPGTAPLLFSIPRGEDGIFEPGGTQVESLFSYGAYASKEHRIVLGYLKAEKKFELATWAQGTRHEDFFTLKDVSDDRDVALVFDRIVYAASGSLFAQHVVAGQAPTAKPINIGAVAALTLLPEHAGSLPSSIRGCKTAEALIVVARTVEGEVVAMDTGDKWWPMHGATTHNDWTGNALTCRGREAFIVRRSISYLGGGITGSIALQRCSVDACTQQVLDVRDFFREVKELEPQNSYLFQTAELDGRLLVVWKGGNRGGIRMRIAPADAIAQAEDHVILDDLVPGLIKADDSESRVTEMRLFSRSGSALLLLRTGLGVHALKIEPNGTVTPIEVRR